MYPPNCVEDLKWGLQDLQNRGIPVHFRARPFLVQPEGSGVQTNVGKHSHYATDNLQVTISINLANYTYGVQSFVYMRERVYLTLVQIYTQETAHSLSFLHHARILECSPSRESPPTFPSHHVSINGTITEFDSFPFTRDLLTWHHQVLQHTSNTSQQCEVQRAIRNMSNQVSTEVDSWIETTKRCQYLPENNLKAREVINRESRPFCFLLMPISSRCHRNSVITCVISCWKSQMCSPCRHQSLCVEIFMARLAHSELPESLVCCKNWHYRPVCYVWPNYHGVARFRSWSDLRCGLLDYGLWDYTRHYLIESV